MKKGDQLVTLKMLTQAFAEFGRTFGREMRDFVRQEILASETRVKTELRQEIKDAKEEVIDSVNQVLNDHVLPSIDDHEKRLLKLETTPQH